MNKSLLGSDSYYYTYSVYLERKLVQSDDRQEDMSQEIFEELVELRCYLEKRIKALEDEAHKMKTLFKVVDEVIVSKSFRGAETISMTPPEPKAPLPVSEGVESIPLKTAQGILLGEVFIDPQSVRIVPIKTLAFNINTPPFQSFFISRILEQMKNRGEEAVQRGDILPAMTLSFDVITEEDIIKEVVIRNYGSERRLREIKSSCRWTLEKMYERQRQKSS